MGQRVIGVLYGGALLNRFKNVKRKFIDKRVGKDPTSTAWCKAVREFVPDTEFDCGNVLMCGFWVLCKHGEEKGCDSLGDYPIAFADIDNRKARDQWERFSMWARTQGVEFPQAQLWLLSTEVA